MNSSPSRRRFLRGLGASIALPAFESTWAAPSAGPGLTSTGAPLRFAVLYLPNGVHVPRWMPTGSGPDYQPGPTFAPLAAFRDHFQVISRLQHENGKPGTDGGGGHARAVSTFLTGARPLKTTGAQLRLGVSADQVAARHLAGLTRLPSLELTCSAVRASGRCDSGYSCAYQFNLSWRSESTPMTPEPHPRLVFERLFGSPGSDPASPHLARRQAEDRSILDYVLDDAHSLQRELPQPDRHKLDEYLTGLREVERRLETAERFPVPDPGVPPPPHGIPSRRQDHLRLMTDLLVLAFQTDSTRVATLLQAHDGDNYAHRDLGLNDGHHTLSHHQNDPARLAAIARIDLFYMELFRDFLARLQNTQDIDGHSLLHNSVILYGGGLSDGQEHSHENLPVVLAGHGGGLLRPGGHLAPSSPTPMANLYLSLFDLLGLPHQERFGDSTGRLSGLL